MSSLLNVTQQLKLSSHPRKLASTTTAAARRGAGRGLINPRPARKHNGGGR